MSKRWFVRAASTSFLSPQKLSLPPAAKDSSKQKSRSLPLDDGGTPKTRSSTISDVDTNRPHTASGSSGKSEENDGTELLRRRTALSPDSNRLRVMKAVSLPEDRYMYVENIVRHDSLGIAVGIESVIMGDIESLSWGKHAPKASRFELCGKMDQPLLHPCRPVVILNEVRFVHCVDNDQTKKDTRSLTSVDLSTSEMRASIFTKLSPLAWVGDESVLLVDVPRTEGCYRFHLWDALGSNEVKKVGFSIKCSTPSTFQLRGGGTRDGKWIFANAIGVEAAIYSVEDDARYDIGDSTLALTMASLTVGDESKYFVMWASEGLVSSHFKLTTAEVCVRKGEIALSRVQDTLLPGTPRNLPTSPVGEFPELLVSEKLGLVVAITGHGDIHLVEIESATLLYSTTITTYLETETFSSASVCAISDGGCHFFVGYTVKRDKDERFFERGDVFTIVPENLIPYVRRHFKHNENLAMAISGRTGLRGAEDLWMKHYPS